MVISERAPLVRTGVIGQKSNFKMTPLENVIVIVPTLNANGALLQDHVVGLNRWVANARAFRQRYIR